jgi:hypothetical protein
MLSRSAALGLVGFLTALAGTYLITVTGTAVSSPRSWSSSPSVLDFINQYLLAVIINGFAASGS